MSSDMYNWQYEINPKEHPEEITVVSLHCGATQAEMADSQYTWIVETNKELRTVLEVLDEVISEGGDDVMYTVLFVPKKKNLDPSVIRDQAESVLDID